MPKSILEDSETCLKSLFESLLENKKKTKEEEAKKKTREEEKAWLKRMKRNS